MVDAVSTESTETTTYPEIDDAPELEIGGRAFEYQEVLDLIAAGEWEATLEEIYKSLDQASRDTFYNDALEAVAQFAIDFKALSDVYEGKADYSHELGDDVREEEWETFEDACADISKEFERNVAEATSEAWNGFYSKYIYATESQSLGTSIYEDGDVVEVNLQGGSYYDSLETDWDPEDRDGDLDIDYNDYENWLVEQKSTAVPVDLYLSIEEGYVTTFNGPVNNTIEIICYNAELNKTVTFNVALTEGLRILVDSPSECVTSATIADMDESIQKITYLGTTGIYSIFETENEVSDIEKLDFLPFWNGLESRETYDTTTQWYEEGGEATSDEYYSLYQECMQTIFKVYNDSDSTSQVANMSVAMTEVMTLIQSTFENQMDQINIWYSLIMGIAMKAERKDFEWVFASGGADMIMAIENVFAVGDHQLVSATGAAMCGILEMFSGTTGNYGGEEFLSMIQQQTDAGEPLFTEFGDADYIMDVYDEFNALLEGNIPWAVNTGETEQYTEDLETRSLEEQYDISFTMTTDYAAAAKTAAVNVNVNLSDADEVTDGITKENYEIEMAELFLIAGTVTDPNTGEPYSIEQIANNIQNYISNLDEAHKDDVAAAFIHYLNQQSHEYVRALCAVSGFGTFMSNQINNGDNDPVWIDEANHVINNCWDELVDDEGNNFRYGEI